MQQENVFFNPTPEVRKKRLKKFSFPLEYQGPLESEKLWYTVTQAINSDDQVAATEAKTRLEKAQRERAKERKSLGQEWVPKYFVQVRYTSFLYSIFIYILSYLSHIDICKIISNFF